MTEPLYQLVREAFGFRVEDADAKIVGYVFERHTGMEVIRRHGWMAYPDDGMDTPPCTGVVHDSAVAAALDLPGVLPGDTVLLWHPPEPGAMHATTDAASRMPEGGA